MWAQKQFELASPDGKLKVNINMGKTIEYSVNHDEDAVLERSPISLALSDGATFGKNSKLSGTSKRSVNNVIEAQVYKRKQVVDNYNELVFRFKENFNLVFRAYNDGVAYRFVSTGKNPITVVNEEAIFNFNADNKAYIPYVLTNEPKSFDSQLFNSFENVYSYSNLSEWKENRLAFLPIVLEAPSNKKIAILEADLISYPGMFLYPQKGKYALEGVFAGYPGELQQGGYNMIQEKVLKREPYIAKYDKGNVEFPWRAIVVAEDDYQLADNDMVYKLSTPMAKGIDFSWVKPGKVAWEWWNDWNLYNVDFKAGINNETYKYYIDFASKYGIEYVILDDGWSTPKKADLFDIVPEIDLKELVAYGNSKNVGIILWAGYYAFNKDIEGICKHYSEMGIKGFKIDFMDRDDQIMVNFHYNAAEIAAKYKLLVDFHGTYKPTGLHRTFPNVVNNEGVYGLEQLKFEHRATDLVTYEVTIPFVRMIAGQLDYTQGAMRNGSKESFRYVYREAMSQGTRCRQLAEYVIFESPLNMLCDSPSNYMQEGECTRFIAGVPTVWDNTIALNGEIGKYVSIARQKDDVWYVGSITNWDERDLELDLSFLPGGSFKAEVFKDGINAAKAARDYKKEEVTIPENRRMKIHMAPGGGFVMKISKVS